MGGEASHGPGMDEVITRPIFGCNVNWALWKHYCKHYCYTKFPSFPLSKQPQTLKSHLVGLRHMNLAIPFGPGRVGVWYNQHIHASTINLINTKIMNI